MINKLRIGLIFLSLILAVSLGNAQDRVSEKDVQLEQLFIEANLEKILGNYTKAISLYQDILKKDRKNHAANYEIARIYDIQSDGDKAIKSIKSAINLEPDNIWYKKFLADLYQKSGQNTEAAKLYEDMVKKDPNNEYLYYRWAYFLVRANDINNALKVYDELENKLGLNEELIRRKHSLYLGIGNQKKAGKELERLIEAYPNDISYRHILAEFYLQIDEKGDAEKVYREILEINPDDAKAKLALVRENKPGKSSKDDFVATLKPVFERPDVDIDLKIGRILPFIQEVANTENRTLAGQLLQLTDVLEQVHPNEAKAFSAAGDLLYYSGQKEEAIQKYQKTLELDDTVFSVWEQLMTIHFENRDFKSLEKTSEEAMDLFPNKARASFFNGLALHELGEVEDAIDILEQSLMMAANDGRLLFDIQSQLGLSYLTLRQFNSAKAAFEAALQLNKNAPMVLNNYSYMLAQSGEDLEKAAEMAKLANEIAPDQAILQDTYAWVFYKMKEYKKAKEWAGKAMENGGENNPNILEHYGDILFQFGEKDSAIEYWQRALDNGSNSKLLEKKIADKQLYE